MAKNPIVTIEMENGDIITAELYPEIAPQSVYNFVHLVQDGFYDGLIFHRVIPGFMIQGGCPFGTGTGGPGWTIRGEFSANGVKNELKHTRGVLSMARTSDPDSAGSQFFIMHADSDFLDGKYAAFGMMTEGFVELDSLAMTPVTYNLWGEKSVPLEDVVIKTIRVETFGVDYSDFEKIQ
jgi:peptidyl-prolyl cis-trans isomerase B (cyclophilin B)